MDKSLCNKDVNCVYIRFLKEYTETVQAESFLFQGALYFIASETRIQSIFKAGILSSALLEDVNYFMDHYDATQTKTKRNDAILISEPLSFLDKEQQSLFVGIIAPIDERDDEELKTYIKGLAISMKTYYNLVTTIQAKIQAQDLLETSNYEITFTALARALIACYEQYDIGHISILKRKRDILHLFLSSFQMNDTFLCELATMTANIQDSSAQFIQLPLEGTFYVNHVVFPIMVREDEVMILLFSFELKEEALQAKRPYEQWLNGLSPLLQKGYEYEESVKESVRRDHLLQVTKKFHSTMDIGDVLKEIVQAIQKTYPMFQTHLLLSQEWQVSEELLIKPLLYGRHENKLAEHAYISGQIQMKKDESDTPAMLYVPLRGKQGVYGIMEIEMVGDVYLPPYEIEFIQMLADTGGNALENAELYQKSHHLIHDLQLINETSRQLNLNLRLADTISFMTKQIIESFDADEVGFIMFHKNGESIVLQGSTSFFSTDESLNHFDSIITEVKQKKDALYIGDTHTRTDIKIHDFQSLLVVPMIQNSQIMGVVLTLHKKAYHFTFEDFKLLQSLIHHSTLAFTNSMLHEELELLVITDYLTKLYSRNHLDEQVQLSMSKEERGAFLLLDIDDFKQINDTYGHQVGDDIIIQIANIMTKSVRKGDIVARWGGEELAIYLPGVDIIKGKEVAKRVVHAVSVETSPKVTASIGVSHWTVNDKNRSLKKLFNEADEALYEAKERGKNNVVIKR